MRSNKTRLGPLLGLLLASVVATVHADHVLFDFAPGFNLEHVAKSDAEIQWIPASSGRGLRIRTGTSHPWPGVTLPVPESHRDLSAFWQVELRVRNTGTNRVIVNCRVDNPGADGANHCVTGRVELEPDATQILRVPLKRTSQGKLDGKLFGLRGYPVMTGGPGTVDPRNITQLLLFVNKPAASHTFEVQDIRATGIYTPPTASVTDADPYFPLIDTFGQYKHRDWQGKVYSVEELRARRDTEANQLARDPGPQGWNQYGGWAAGPQLQATGFFRTEKHAGKWWLVDPEGRLFWSHGIDCVRGMDYTTIEERENWFEDFPGQQSGYEKFSSVHRSVLKGHYAGRATRVYSFAGANLQRKYGGGWQQVVPGVMHQRLRSWGLNTIGNWSDEGVRLLRRTPYTDTISSRGAPDIEGSEGYWSKFPDVFDPAFEQAVRKSAAARAGKSANDPWCIGYFSDNEMSWGDDTSLALAAIKSPPEQAAKKAFLENLQAKYGDIEKLNRVWGTEHKSWGALLQTREPPDRENAHTDLTEFYSKAAGQYFRTVRDAIKAVAPNQLYLGCRFAWVNDHAAIAAGKYCDVVSYNRYERSVANFKYPGDDKPLLIGEFHFGALDRGMFHTGLVPVENQAERARAYQEYVQGALRHPQLVGTHWFQWQDQPTTGRVFDEENYQIGFVDIADTPYRETVDASRQIGAQLYETRLGK